MPWPDARDGTAERHPERPAETQGTNTATNGTVILPDAADPRRVGELLGDWLAIRMAEVDDLVAEAKRKVELLPDQSALWLVIGELVVRLACVERELAELKAARR